MENRFKFRVWDKERKEMFYLSRYPRPDEFPEFTLEIWGNLWELLKSYNDKENISVLTDDSNAILLQSTGLEDKNGKLIFEGDLIEVVSDDPLCYKGKIYWDYEDCSWMIQTFNHTSYQNIGNSNFEYLNQSLQSIIEVIGNIYENPELMEVV